MTTATETQGTAQQSNSHSPKMIRGYLIRPSDRTVHTVELPDGDNHLASMYALIECDTVDCVRLSDQHDCWVDDEGLLKRTRHFFAIWRDIEGHPRGGEMAQLCGNALILSHDDEGNSTSAAIPPKLAGFVLNKIIFFDMQAATAAAIKASITRPDKIAGHIVVGLDGSLTATACP